MSKIDPKIIDKIIDNVDIVTEISKDIDLVKKGSNFVGLCPFHPDNNPSFYVNPEKKICNCFVCHSGGNVISYRQKYNKISFYEATKLLANEIGIEMQEQHQIEQTPKHLMLLEAMKFYHQILKVTTQGKNVREYLQKRGMDDVIVNRHLLGYCDPKLNTYQYLENEAKNKKFSYLDIEQSNLFNKSNYDFFANRLVIPIFDDDGRCVGASGRIIDNSNTSKYINSSESDIFEKKKILYNLNNAKNNLKNGQLIIVEGFFDVFSFEEQGVYNVVAAMGTTLTNNHLELLRKYKIKEVILAYDQDKAGMQANLDFGDRLYKNGFTNVKVITFDHYKDIDEYVQAGNNVDDLINGAVSYIRFKMQHLEVNLEDVDSIKKYINEILSLVDINNSDYEFYVQRLAQELSLTPDIVKNYHTSKNSLSSQTPPLVDIPYDTNEYASIIPPTYKEVPISKNYFFNDEMVLIKHALNRSGFTWLANNLAQNPSLITDENLMHIYHTMESIYRQNSELNNITFSMLADDIEPEYFELLQQIIDIDYIEDKVDTIVEKPINQNRELANLLNMKGK